MKNILISLIIIIGTVTSSSADIYTEFKGFADKTQLDRWGGSFTIYLSQDYTLTQLKYLLSRFKDSAPELSVASSSSGTKVVNGVRYNGHEVTYSENITGVDKVFSCGLSGQMWDGKLYQATMGIWNFKGFVESSQLDNNGGTFVIYFHPDHKTSSLSDYSRDLMSREWFKGFTFSTTSNDIKIVDGVTYWGYECRYPSNNTGNPQTYDFMLRGNTAWNGIFHQSANGGIVTPSFNGDVTKNWIGTKTYTTSNGSNYMSSVEYYDGFGLKIITHNLGITPTGQNLVSLTEHSVMGLETKQWLPVTYSGTQTYFTPNQVIEKVMTSGMYTGYSRYSYNIYEKSTLSRLKQVISPGDDVAGAPLSMDYLSNNRDTDMLNCRLFRVTGTVETQQLVDGGYYATGELKVTRITDPDQNVSLEFTDKFDRVVLTRQMNATDKLDTYYVYDIYGNLCYVLPPALSEQATISEIGLNQYAYQYKYDLRNRCIEKKLPGAEWEYYVYDKADRLVGIQDAYFRQRSSWKAMFYDNFDRCIKVFIYNYNYTRTQFQDLMDNSVGFVPGTSGNSIDLHLMRYDDPDATDLNVKLNFAPVSAVVALSDVASLKGMLNYERKAIVAGDESNSFTYIMNRYFYDYKGRLVQMTEANHLGGISRTSYKYDFLGNILTKHESHQPSATATADILLTNYVYDHAGRLTKETTTLNNGTAASVDYTYDELGRLKNKTFAGNANLKEEYAYNMRDWETSRSNPNFSMALRYTNPTKGNKAQYGGNISEWEFTQKGSGATGEINTYGFTYDSANRLTDTRRYIGTATTASLNNTEKDITYDKNGNIKSLKRYSSTGALTDNFSYNYTGNQLTSLSGSQYASYTYDGNGNMTRDGKRGLNITYNYLNLTSSVASTTTTNYSWSADGAKLSAKNGTNGYEYLGSLIYVRQNNVLSLESAGFGEGRIYKSSSTYTPNYFFTDHLGSPRVIVNPGGTVLSRMNYFAFGKLWDGGEQSSRWNYNGKERQDITGTNILDYGARMYDPDLVRWPNIDPMAEKYYSISPYVYVGNNPIIYVDPDGKVIEVHDFVNNQRITYNWKEHNGTWGFYDANNTIYAGNNTFIGELSGALSDIMNGGVAGFDLVSGLANHSNTVTLMYSPDSGADSQNRVGWNPTGIKRDGSLEAVPTTAGMSNDPMATLAHELAHVDFNWNIGNGKTWFNMTVNRNGNPTKRPVSTSEIHTTHLENRIRAENGLPLRTYYGKDASGAGVGPRIIKPSSGTSMFYNSQGVTNYKTLKRGINPYKY